MYRDYNEDRVDIITNILVFDEATKSEQKSSFFGLFDGHAGSACVDFVKDNLHRYISEDSEFLRDKAKAIRNGIFECEKEWLKIARGNRRSDINLNFVNRLKLSEPQFDPKLESSKKIGHSMWDQYN